jgi:hypothetical protein
MILSGTAGSFETLSVSGVSGLSGGMTAQEKRRSGKRRRPFQNQAGAEVLEQLWRSIPLIVKTFTFPVSEFFAFC